MPSSSCSQLPFRLRIIGNQDRGPHRNEVLVRVFVLVEFVDLPPPASIPEVLAGELAAKNGNFDQAIAGLHRGVLLEDNLIYNEPPDWHVPVRQSLGAVLLAAGRPEEAESIYWQDLSRNRENGWSLFGLLQSLRALGKTDEAAVIEQRFRKAWDRADVTLTASRFMGETSTTLAAKSGN